MAHTIWLDVDDLVQYAVSQPRPSGIQQLGYELCRALVLAEATRDSVRFLRHDASGRSFRVLRWEELAARYDAMVNRTPEPARAAPAVAAIPRKRRQALRELAYRLPADLRQPLQSGYMHQRLALSGFVRLARILLHRRASRDDPVGVPTGEPESVDFASVVQPGDILITVCGDWGNAGYPAMIETARRTHGLRYGLLIYDLIPIRRPEWCPATLVRPFTSFIDGLLPLADLVFTISHATSADVRAYAAETGIIMHASPIVLPIGTGFHRSPPDASDSDPPSARVPPPGFALIVSTIEVRKNHLLLFHVWRRLLDEMTPDQVPTLVFAGRLGWLVGDLMRQLESSRFLDGKIVLIEDPSDAELAQLYDRCSFTLFPSFYEGWGLPVTESLGFGRPCLASSATSLPEAGGRFARYFSAGDVTAAYMLVRRLIEYPAELAAWQAEIARDYVPVPWRDTTEALADAVSTPMPVSQIA